MIRLWFEKFGQAWTACMLCMVQGDLTVLSLSHAMTAAKTGSLAGLAFVFTAYFTVINSKWFAAWLTGILTMVADIVVHPTHFGANWMEAACTGLGAAILCTIYERKTNG